MLFYSGISGTQLFNHVDLEPYISHGAAHNSDERCDAPKCEPETRVAVQEDIFSWMIDSDRPAGDGKPRPKVLWLSGPAGSGKTAIAGSIAETLKDSGFLAASFFFSFFSGAADRRLKRCLVATLACHLAEHDALAEYKAQLLKSIERQPGVFRKRLKEQAEVLILKPLRAIPRRCDGAPSWPLGIVVDGLDEVTAEQSATSGSTGEESKRRDEDDQVEVLEVLFTLAMDPAFPFRIVIASRRDRAITEFFTTRNLGCGVVEFFLDSKYNPDSDIERFLKSKFAAIRRRSGMSDPSWPGQEVIEQIVDMSSGQFIVPATIIRHIMTGVPQRKLHEILKLEWVRAGTRNPFAALDMLYTHILKQSPEPRLTVQWISSIHQLSGKEPQPASFWRQFLETVDGELSYVMGNTASLIFVPPIDDRQTPFHFYHKSLLDYLAQEARCGDLFVDEASMNSFRAERCTSVLERTSFTCFEGTH